MRVVILADRHFLLPFHKELVVVEVAGVGRNAEIVAHVDMLGHFFAGHEGFVQLLAMTGADHLHWRVCLVEALQGVGQHIQRGCRRFLHKQIAVLAMLEGIEHQVHRIIQGHHEAGHVRIGHGDRPARPDLVDPQGNHRTAAGHDIAITGTANGGGSIRPQCPPLGNGHLLHHRLADAHGIDGISRLVRAQHHHVLHAMLDGGIQHIVGAEHVGLHRLHGEEFAGRHLFQSGRLEHIVHPAHGAIHRTLVAHIPDVELHLRVLQRMAHVILLLFIAGKDADFAEGIRMQETVEDSRAEGAGATGDEEGFRLMHRKQPVERGKWK